MVVREAMRLALEHHRQGRLAQAEEIYRQILLQEPNDAEVIHLLGVVIAQDGRMAEAGPFFRETILLQPNHADAHNNLGNVLWVAGRWAAAQEHFHTALRLRPDHAGAHTNLAHLLVDQDRAAEAVEHYRTAIRLAPNSVAAFSGLCLALVRLDRVGEAVEAGRGAVRLGPRYLDAWQNLAVALAAGGQYDEAIRTNDRAIELRPDAALAHWNRSLIRLLQGDFARGWPEYEWRRNIPENPISEPRPARPLWDGSDLHGRTILLHFEQGFGDTIQFIRYAPLVAGRGGRVIVRCQAELRDLIGGMESVAQVVGPSQPPGDFDVQVPLLSLPRLFGTTLQTIPASTPYLKADAAKVAAWSERLGPAAGRRRAGLSWSGRSKPDPARSIPAAALAPLEAIAGVEFFSLQKSPAPGAAGLPLPVVDLMPRVEDFSDTAALIEHLDLVLTIDTAVAHLAGAMGKPVWVMLPFVPAWRWLLDRQDSPWYPTMRLFRQSAIGDWAGVVHQVARELAKWPGGRSGRGNS